MGGTTMKRFRTIVTALFLMGIILSARVSAQDTSPKDPYSGDLWNRSTLTGDWGALRNEWAQKGITFDFNITQVGQGYIHIDSPAVARREN
jgi:hypothetical protein